MNAVAPGPVETEGVLEVWKTPAMIAQAAREVPLQRLGRPEEIAWAVVFVASDGEWVRFTLPDDSWLRRFARKRALPIYDAGVMGYPKRMREYRRDDTSGPGSE